MRAIFNTNSSQTYLDLSSSAQYQLLRHSEAWKPISNNLQGTIGVHDRISRQNVLSRPGFTKMRLADWWVALRLVYKADLTAPSNHVGQDPVTLWLDTPRIKFAVYLRN
jgi:hypothetical protein